MKDREATIEFAMNYCQHYKTGGQRGTTCAAGMDIKAIQCVLTCQSSMKWGPCMGGHTLADPLAHCPKWLRQTREYAEKRADHIERSMKQLTLADPVISAWRKKPPLGKSEIIECPVCQKRLHLSQAAYNGHVRAQCETTDCINFIE